MNIFHILNRFIKISDLTRRFLKNNYRYNYCNKKPLFNIRDHVLQMHVVALLNLFGLVIFISLRYSQSSVEHDSAMSPKLVLNQADTAVYMYF